MSARRSWSLDDDKALILGAKAGRSRAAIGMDLGRTVDAVSYRAFWLRQNGVEVPSLNQFSSNSSATRLRELRKFADTLKGMP